MTIQQANEFIRAEIEREVNSWFRAQAQNTFGAYHAYFTPGRLTISDVQPAGMALVDSRRISPAWTVGQAREFLRTALQRLPILPIE